jgi:hypothetical protein
VEQRFEGITDVLHQVESISHLQGVGHSLAAGQRINPGTIADHDRDPGMEHQPRS